MTLEFRPFLSPDLSELLVQGRHQAIRDEIVESGVAGLLEGPFSWTALDNGRPIACCGIFCQKYRPRRPGLAWAFLAPDLRRHMLSVTRHVRIALAACPRPVLAEIDAGFPEGVRWASLLGFVPFGRYTWIYDAHLQ